MVLQFKHPFTCIVAGPTSCGKTVFTFNFLENLSVMCDKPIENIVYYYDEWQPNFENKSAIKFKKGLPNIKEYNGLENSLIIIDDMMKETNDIIVNIFTKGSHHRNLSVIYITQNLFHQGRGQRDISLNANYIIYFKNPRDKAQIIHLARQLYPENSRYLQEAYMDATHRPHGYLFLDLKQSTPEKYRVGTNILPSEQPCFIYQPKKGYKYDNGDID